MSDCVLNAASESSQSFCGFFFCLTSKSDELGKASNCVAVNLARHTNCVWLCKMKNTVVENTSKRSHSEIGILKHFLLKIGLWKIEKFAPSNGFFTSEFRNVH